MSRLEAHVANEHDDLARRAANGDALLLHTQGGMSLQEIADLKYAALGTVKAWVHRARAEIARVLDEADR